LAQELSPSYPDAHIDLDLRGVSEEPLTSSEAMTYVIRAFHPEAKPPESSEELRAICLSVLHGNHARLLMNKAGDRAQAESSFRPPAVRCSSPRELILRCGPQGEKPRDASSR
jgi:hypothetical protein